MVAAALAATGCTSLPPIARGTCGNGVVEVEAGEDCDLFAPDGKARCAAPGEPNECRLTCGPAPGGAECPSRMACGSDGVCRTPSGRYLATASSFPAHPRELFSADLDGDGRMDLLEHTDDGVLAHYFGDALSPDGTLEIPSEAASGEAPAIGELTGDHRADILLPFSGVVVMMGSEDRIARPKAHPGIAVQGVQEVALAPGQTDPTTPDPEYVVLGTVGGVSGLAAVTYAGQTDVLALMPGRPSQLAGPIAMANFDDRPTSPCDEAVLSYREDSPLSGPPLLLYSLCTQDASGTPILNHAPQWTAIDLGGAHVELAASALDLDGDGHLDLVIGVERSGQHEIDVAYGIGDGTFASAPPAGSTLPGDNRASFYGAVVNGPPIAFARLDGDALLDYVTATEIRTSRGGALGSSLAAVADVPFLEAMIADVNANGVLDVVATGESPSLEVYSGTGDGRFAYTRVPMQSQASHLTPGDFDGDGVIDLALAEHLPPAADGTAEDSISVAFGRAWGVPASPASMGRLDPTQQIAVLLGADRYGVVDGVADLVTISKVGDDFVISGFSGRTDRALRAPYGTTRNVTGPEPLTEIYFPSRVMIGELTGDGHPDVVEIVHPSPQQPSLGWHAWLTPCTGEARLLQESASVSADLSDQVRWGASMNAALDLDGDAVDELVTLATLSSDPGAGVSVVSRAIASGDGTFAWEISPPAPVGFQFERVEEPDRPAGETRGAAARTADFDGDGRLDLLALASSAGKTVPVVFFNDHDGALSPPVPLNAPDGSVILAFGLVQADADPQKEVALLASGAVYLAECHSPDRAVTVSAVPIAAPVTGSSLITCGDFDGDGVDDIATSGDGGIELFRGLPAQPGAEL